MFSMLTPHLFVFSAQLSQRYRNSSMSQLNSRSEAIDGLKNAFEFVERECPGVCDFLVKEVVTALSDSRRGHSVTGESAGGSSSRSVATTSSSSMNPSLHPHNNSHSPLKPSPQSQSQSQSSGGRGQTTSSQATAWKFRNAFD